MKDPKRYITFMEFVYSHSGDDSEVGDLCASALLDPAVSLKMSQKEYVIHLHGLISQGKAERTVLKTVEVLNMAYRSYRNRIEEAILAQSETTWLGSGDYVFGRKPYSLAKSPENT